MLFRSALPVGLKEMYKQANLFQVYPNPFTTKFTIELSNTNEPVTIELYNVIGDVIKKQITSESKTSIDLTAYSSGVYFVKVSTTNGSDTKRLVKN